MRRKKTKSPVKRNLLRAVRVRRRPVSAAQITAWLVLQQQIVASRQTLNERKMARFRAAITQHRTATIAIADAAKLRYALAVGK